MKSSKLLDCMNQTLRTRLGIELTPQEMDVLACLVCTKKSSIIAKILHLSPKKIQEHVQNILRKMNSNSVDDLIERLQKDNQHGDLKEYASRLRQQNRFEQDLQETPKTTHAPHHMCLLIVQDHGSHEATACDLLAGLQRCGFSCLGCTANSREFKDYLKEGHVTHVIYLVPTKAQHAGQASLSVAQLNHWVEEHDDITWIIIREGNDCPLFSKEHVHHIGLIERKNHQALVMALTQILLPTASNAVFPKRSMDTVLNAQILVSLRSAMGSIFSYWYQRWKMIAGILVLAGMFWLFFQHGQLLSPYIQERFSANKTPLTTWNLPMVMPHYVERPDLTQMIWDRLNEQNVKKATVVLASLRGLGGAGKTFLATHAICHARQHYDFRGWFRAETEDLLEADYLELGKQQQLLTQDMSNKQKIQAVKSWLEKQPSSLLVYDNVPDMETLQDYLPSQGHIIITSRNHHLAKAIDVEGMTETEAVALLDHLIPESLKQQAGYGVSVKELVRELGYLPLALAQAGAYMASASVPVDEYKAMYQKMQIKMLTENVLPPGDQHNPVYVTWDMNIKSIQAQPKGTEAIQLLDFIAYCYPEHIPKKLLMQYLMGDVHEGAQLSFHQIIRLLQQYSLIKLSNEGISIHRLVHEWIRHQHGNHQIRNVIEKAITAFKTIVPKDYHSPTNYVMSRALIPHQQFPAKLLKQCKSWF